MCPGLPDDTQGPTQDANVLTLTTRRVFLAEGDRWGEVFQSCGAELPSRQHATTPRSEFLDQVESPLSASRRVGCTLGP